MRNIENREEFIAQRKAHYESKDVNGRLVINLRDIGHAMKGLYEGRGSQKRILIVLEETGTITQRELTERLGIQPGSASEVIAKLENAGLVARTVSESDRRTADISLTKEGLRQAKEAKDQQVQRHVEMFSALTADEKTQLLALLEKVNADWETRYADRRGHHHGHHHGREIASNGEFHGHHHHEHGDVRSDTENHRGCDHDCANCPNPCGRGRALRGEGR